MIDPVVLRGRAHALADERLFRSRALLERVGVAERIAIDDVAHAIAGRVAECLLAEAATCPSLAWALADESGYWANGSSKKKVEPSPALEATQMRPPIRRTSSRQM